MFVFVVPTWILLGPMFWVLWRPPVVLIVFMIAVIVMVMASLPSGVTWPVRTRQRDPVSASGPAVVPTLIVIEIVIAMVAVVGPFVQVYRVGQGWYDHHTGTVIGIRMVAVSRNHTPRKEECAADKHKQSEYF
ncbi:MAG TPA: hypothetical protein DCR95_14400 [Desulfobacter sp.]|nr:hypothetical protein [Desulfobacter sp.]